MAERRYRIVLQVETRAADQAAARAAGNQKKVADAVKGVGKAFDEVVPKIEVGYYKLAAAGLKFQDTLSKAADKAARDADKLADRQTRAADRAADAEVRAAQRKADADARRVDKEARDADRLADRQTRAADRAADAQVRASERAAAQSQRAAEKEARDADRLADRRTRVADRAADRDARATQRKADADARRADKEASDADKLADRQTRAADRAADRDARAAKRKADADAKRIDKEARDADKLADRQTRAADRLADREARNEQRKADRRQAIQDRYLKRDYDAAVANERRKQEAAAETRLKVEEYAATAAAAGAVALGWSIVKQFQDVRESAYAATKMVTEYQAALRELAAIKGNTGNTGPELAENLRFRAQTLMSRDESIAFQSAARNTGMASVLTADEAKDPARRGIVEGEFTKGLALVGAMNKARGEDSKSAGELAGIIPMTLQGQSKADDVYKEYVRLNNTFQLGGASVPSLTRQYVERAGLVTSGVMSKEESSAILSSMSVTQREKSGEMMEALVKGTMGSLDRKRGMGIMGGMSQGAYFRDLGINKDMGVLDITRKIVADMDKYQKADTAAGGAGNLMEFLTHKGFVNEHERMALLTMHGQLTSGMFDAKFMPSATAATDVEAEKKRVAMAQQTEAPLLAARNDLAADAANVAVGAGKESTYYRFQKMAFEKAKSEGWWGVEGDYDSFGQSYNPNKMWGLSSVRAEADRMMDAELSKAGLPTIEMRRRETHGPPGPHGMGNQRGMFDDPAIYQEASEQLAAKGVVPGGETLSQLIASASKSVDEQQRIRVLMEQFMAMAQGKNAQAPANARPGP